MLVLWTATGNNCVVTRQPHKANLYKEDFEIKDIHWAELPLRIWKRDVDDTYVVPGSTEKDRFLEHINSIDPYIQFTLEDT